MLGKILVQISCVVIVCFVQNSSAGRYFVQKSSELILANPFVRQIRYYNAPIYSSPRIQHKQPLYIGNYAEPLYQPGYRTALVQNYPSTAYDQDDYLPSADYQDDGPYPARFYEDSYGPPDTHYGPPKPEEAPTTTAPVMVTPCICQPIIPSQPVPEGAPEDMHLPPELTLAPTTDTPEPETTTTEVTTTTTEATTTTTAAPEPPKNTYLPPPPPTEAPTPSNMYLPVEAESKHNVIQGPTPLPDTEEENGYIYNMPYPAFSPEEPKLEEPEPVTTEEPTHPDAVTSPSLPPQFVGGYQPIFLIPFYPQSGFPFYGNPVQIQTPNFPYAPPIMQNGGQGVVITIPSKTYLPPKE